MLLSDVKKQGSQKKWNTAKNMKQSYFVLFLFCVNFTIIKSDFSRIDWISFDFEHIKRDLFLQTDLNNSEISKNEITSSTCLNEIIAIKNGLNSSSDWALKRTYP